MELPLNQSNYVIVASLNCHFYVFINWNKSVFFSIIVLVMLLCAQVLRFTCKISRHAPTIWIWFKVEQHGQIRKIVGCACAGSAGNVFTATYFKGNCYLAIPACTRHVRHARTVTHVEIANPRGRGKRSRQSRHMSKPQFCVSGKRPWVIHPE